MNKKYNFKQAKFFTTVNDLSMLPPESIKEIAVVGRSNVGKSSLLNVLTNQRKLAFVSKTPGRTQHINYFSIDDDGVFLVDLPGYGYAKVPKNIRDHWVLLLGDYLSKRNQLLGLVLIMDIRHPLKELDYQMINFFAQSTNKSIHIVLSKGDKLNKQEQMKTLQYVTSEIKKINNGFTVQLFSSLKKTGLEELESTLDTWLSNT